MIKILINIMLSIKKLEMNNQSNTTRNAMCAVDYNNHNVLSVVSVHLPSTSIKTIMKTPTLLEIIKGIIEKYQIKFKTILGYDYKKCEIRYEIKEKVYTGTVADPDPVPGQQHCIIGSGKKETGTKYYFCQVPGSCEG